MMMQRWSYRSIMPSDDTDFVKAFVAQYDVMNLEEFTKSHNYYPLFCQDFMSGIINENEFRAQIKFQSHLLNECNQKIDQLTTEDKTVEISSKVLEIVSDRIQKMYILWFEILGIDASMVTDYLDFGLKNKLIFTEFKDTLDKSMKYFQMDPNVYVIVARHMFNYFNDVECARKYLKNGIRHHNKYKQLFEEEMSLEIKILISTKGSSLPIVLQKYQEIIDYFKDDINFHFILVNHALNILWVREFPCVVLRDMVNIYKQNEFMWQKLAQIQLSGFIYNFKSEHVYHCKDDLNCISNCINTYEKGLKEDWLPANQQNLWDFFLDNIIEISKSDKMNNKVVKNFVTEAIVRIFDQAHTNNKLHKADHYIFWAQHSPKNKELMILKESVNMMNDNPNLWSELLGYYLSHNYFQRGWSTFQKGINALQEESTPLWDQMNLYLLNTTDDMIQKFYEEASFSKYKNISMIYRPKFLEWMFLRFSLTQARTLFNELKVLQPECKELYTKMIHFECLSYVDDKYSLKCIRNLFSETCNMFGHNDIDLWTNCLKFEYKYGKEIFVEVIYLAALQMLEPDLQSAIVKIKDNLEIQFKNFKSSQISEIIEIHD